MPMIRHQAIGQNAHGHEIQAFFHDTQEILVMSGFPEKARPKVRAVQHMVNHAAHINSSRSTHDRILAHYR